MTPENFAYWLQGLLEVGKIESLDKEQTQQIKDHLQLVFKKETPAYEVIYKNTEYTDVREYTDKTVFHPTPQSHFICNQQQEIPGKLYDFSNIPGITC